MVISMKKHFTVEQHRDAGSHIVAMRKYLQHFQIVVGSVYNKSSDAYRFSKKAFSFIEKLRFELQDLAAQDMSANKDSVDLTKFYSLDTENKA